MADKDIDRKLLNAFFDAVCCVDGARKITYWDTGAYALTGLTGAEVIGKKCSGFPIHADREGKPLCDVACPLGKLAADGKPKELEVFLRDKEGNLIPVSLRLAPVPGERGKVAIAFSLFTTDSPRYDLRRQLELHRNMALRDPVTSLGNRNFVQAAICSRLEEMARYRRSFGIITLDIDGYSSIAKQHGPSATEASLRMVSRTMQKCLRPFDALGRWGDGKFVAVIINVTEESLHAITDRFCDLVSRMPVPGEQGRFAINVSAGAALASTGDNLSRLLRRADRLLVQKRSLHIKSSNNLSPSFL